MGGKPAIGKGINTNEIMKRLLTWLGLIAEARHKAESLYKDFIGKDVIIFYEDAKGVSRKMVGVITSIVGNTMFVHSACNGWQGVINCDVCRIGNISTREGWGTLNEFETK